MNIDEYSSNVWGTDIGSACDILLASECSLAGGFFHIATGCRNLWEDIDSHLWPEERQPEEVVFKQVVKPFPVRCQTPREQSVSRYLAMILTKPGTTSVTEKTCPPQRTLAEQSSPQKTLRVPETNPVSKDITHEPANARIPSANNRSKTSGNADQVKRPKFFRLGDYSGTKPYWGASSSQHRQKAPNMPYFQEVIFTQVSKEEQLKKDMREDQLKKYIREEKLKHDMREVLIKTEDKETAFGLGAGKVAVEPPAVNVKNAKTRRPKRRKLGKPKIIKVMPVDHVDPQKKTTYRHMDNVEKNEKKANVFRRVGAFVRSFRCVFTACFSSRDTKDLP
ncbi:uncharacterized protein LOC135473442 [Liolophura sinensis]|uniref:uncharacterized protein LOC135473442 n=1 Tax=Liolophura sinensis TaxID=3198878 RepID=UPI003159498A